MTDSRQLWLVDDANFPAAESTAELLRFALRYAVLAPSSHNSQPWLFHTGGNAVEIYADRRRRLPVVDPDDRELVMSCGAALYNLRLALSHFRVGHNVALQPVSQDSDLLVKVELTGGEAKRDAQLDEMFAAISNRHTCRHAFDRTPIDELVIRSLREAAVAEGTWLIDVPASLRNTV